MNWRNSIQPATLPANLTLPIALYPHSHPARDHDNRLLIAIKGEAISGSRALQLCSFSFVGWLSFNTLIPPLSFCPYWQQAGHETNNRHLTHTLLTSSRPYLYLLRLCHLPVPPIPSFHPAPSDRSFESLPDLNLLCASRRKSSPWHRCRSNSQSCYSSPA